jgi:hypothetical protein
MPPLDRIIQHRNETSPLLDLSTRLTLLVTLGFAISAAGVVSGAVNRGGDPFQGRNLAFHLIFSAILAPLIENLILAGLLWLTSKILGNQLHYAFASALLLALPRYFSGGPIHVLTAFLAFVQLAACYLAYKQRSTLVAHGATYFLHAAANFITLFIGYILIAKLD